MSSLFAFTSELLVLGGPVVWLLLALSHVVVAITLVKVWQFFRADLYRQRSNLQITQALAQVSKDNRPAALSTLQAATSPAARLLAEALGHLNQRTLTGAALEDELNRFAAAQLNSLRAFLRPLDVIANIAPLLGLFGTVIGMIEAFQAMQAAGSQVDPGVLSGGIWVALLTTAVGLAVAMPAMLLYNWFDQTAERSAAEMQDAIGRLFTLQAGNGNASSTTPSKAKTHTESEHHARAVSA